MPFNFLFSSNKIERWCLWQRYSRYFWPVYYNDTTSRTLLNGSDEATQGRKHAKELQDLTLGNAVIDGVPAACWKINFESLMCAQNVLYVVYLLLCSQSPLKTVIHDATHIINDLFEHVEPSYENALSVQKTVIQSKLGTKEHKIPSYGKCHKTE